MRDDHAPAGDLRRHLGKHRRDVFVGQTVEAVSLHAGAPDVGRQRHQFGDRRLAAVKTGVEAGNLGDTRQTLGDGIDRREVVRLMQRRQRYQLAQLFHHLRRHDRRTGITRAAMDDAMADAEDARAAVA
jgi:hypothetical protein